MTNTLYLRGLLGTFGLAAAALLGACGGEDALVAATPEAETGAPSSSVSDDEAAAGESQPPKPAAGGRQQATGLVGPISYSFKETEESVCLVLPEPLTVTVTGLVDTGTGAHLTIDYAEDRADTSVILVEGGDDNRSWKAGAAVTSVLAASVKGDGSVTLTGEFLDQFDPEGPQAGGGVTISC